MILVLQWGYEKGSDEILDKLQEHPVFNNLIELANGCGMKIATLNRRLKKLRDDGMLVSYRYRNNNMIWLMGIDAKEGYSSWEALQIAKYRRYISLGADPEEYDGYEDEYKEKVLQGVGVFPEEIESLSGTIEEYHRPRTEKEQAFFEKINKIYHAQSLDVSEDLENYVDKLWSKM